MAPEMFLLVKKISRRRVVSIVEVIYAKMSKRTETVETRQVPLEEFENL